MRLVGTMAGIALALTSIAAVCTSPGCSRVTWMEARI